ncbi:hypothetical protein Rs2_46678 [Raphanus sativus]|nr:hypothetical protein Rs2_46678 [Raphanus sativus]
MDNPRSEAAEEKLYIHHPWRALLRVGGGRRRKIDSFVWKINGGFFCSFVVLPSSPQSSLVFFYQTEGLSALLASYTERLRPNKPSISSSFTTKRVFAAPETYLQKLSTNPPPRFRTLPRSALTRIRAVFYGAKQKIRIKLRSYWVPLIEDSCKQILDAARNTNAKTMGPVPLPTKKRIYCVQVSSRPQGARFHFEIRTHQRMIDILYPTAQNH